VNEYLWAMQVLRTDTPVPSEEALLTALQTAQGPHHAIQILNAYRILRDPALARRWAEEERLLSALPADLKSTPLGRDAALCAVADPGTQARFAIRHRPEGLGLDKRETKRLLQALPDREPDARKRLRSYLAAKRSSALKFGTWRWSGATGLLLLAALGVTSRFLETAVRTPSFVSSPPAEVPHPPVRQVSVPSPDGIQHISFILTGAQRMDGTGLDAGQVESAIAQDIVRDPPLKSITRRIRMGDRLIEYHVLFHGRNTCLVAGYHTVPGP